MLYHHGQGHVGMQADPGLEKWLRFLYLVLQATGRQRHWTWLGILKPQRHPSSHPHHVKLPSNSVTTLNAAP